MSGKEQARAIVDAELAETWIARRRGEEGLWGDVLARMDRIAMTALAAGCADAMERAAKYFQPDMNSTSTYQLTGSEVALRLRSYALWRDPPQTQNSASTEAEEAHKS